MAQESLPLVTKPLDTNADVAPKHHRLLGLGLVALSALTFSLMSAGIKYESAYMTSMQTLFWRGFVAWAFNFVLVLATRTSLTVDRELAPYLVFRCIIGFITTSLTFWTVSQMVLADASCIIFTSPVMTFLLGAIFLGERIKPLDFGLAILCFVGVVFVARPTFLFGDAPQQDAHHGSKWAVLAGLAGAMCQASAYTSIRRIKDINFLVVIHYFMLTLAVLSAAWILTFEGGFKLNLPQSVWWSCLGSGFLGFVGQLFMTKGFQLENIGIASVMRYLDIVFVFIWDTTLLHEKISVWSFVGAAIILSSAVAIAVRKAHQG
ncbi:hypothetical protein LEN26_000682 [Aphanomyces euteiches]|nr:hypothetical protein AeMF1_007911 [Aphanomyces euteiches]KAH9119319.1 hypothetical protein AeMF1_007909 [Aphanomyces euteiches]KAH9163019.1 hypothetical protein LEN26_000682 [Aphanomyces euteiches]KAH9187432.1 hypothetical protein AeNC1_010595 [Aphanomyces euteiches]